MNSHLTIDTSVSQDRRFPPGTFVRCSTADSTGCITGCILKNGNVKILRVNALTHSSPEFTFQNRSSVKEFFLFVQSRIDAERINVTLPKSRGTFTINVPSHLPPPVVEAEDVLNISSCSESECEDPTNI